VGGRNVTASVGSPLRSGEVRPVNRCRGVPISFPDKVRAKRQQPQSENPSDDGAGDDAWRHSAGLG
jgi:hypothetical protein